MKIKTLHTLTAAILLLITNSSYAQAPTLGTAADFVLFSTNGAVSNVGISHLTGHVGTNSGSSTGFGNVNGVMHDNDVASALCAADLLSAYNQLNATVPTFFPAPLLGNGQTLNAGVYSIAVPATLNLDLTLDGQGNPGAVFIFQIQGAFSSGASAKVHLVNGAQACNVFWKIEGLVDLAAGTTMRGTIIANNAAINMASGDTLEGRAMSTTGAVTINGTMAYTPIGCGSPVLTGPLAPALGTTACYALFSGIGPVTNTGVTFAIGDVGSNNGLTTGYNPLNITGAIHPVPDGSTAACATDFTTVYNYLNALPYDIELLYPAQFGNNLVLTPHTYLMNSAVTFTDTLFLNAQGDANAVFVIKVNGAFGTSTYSKVVLMNGAQAQNVYWKIDGAIDINNYSIFNGTIIAQGAINLFTGVTLNGRALTGVGAINTTAINVVLPPGCPSLTSPVIITDPMNQSACIGDSVSFVVVATGTGLTYQWRKGNVNLVNGGNISGATNDTLTINPVALIDAAANYNVIVSGAFMPSDTSANISLTINTASAVTTQPSSQTACPGDSVSFVVGTTGSGLTYQWRRGIINLINGGNISGATNDTLTINPVLLTDAALNYNVIVSGACSANDTSGNAALNINTTSVITSGPVNQTACVGDSVSFTVTATGSGLTYQWKKGLVNVINGASISGATTATLTFNPVALSHAGLDYYVIVSGTCSLNDTSANASLTVNPSPLAVATGNSPVCANNSILLNAQTVTGASYAWTGPNAYSSSVQNSIIPFAMFTDAGVYSLTVTAGGCSSAPSSVSIVVTNCDSLIEFNLPEGFSPNNDGINDVFVILGIENYPGNSFIIYNRWGVKVFDASPYENTWNGRNSNGVFLGDGLLPVGTYFYTLDLNDDSDVIKGTIYLNR